MTHYEQEIRRIRKAHFSNQAQLATIIRMRNFIIEYYYRDINLHFLSENLFVSKFHLLRLFKRYYGQTPRQYLIDYRMEQAKTLLKTGLSAADTCYAIGFACPSSFSTLFKERNGMAPAAFQKQQFSQSRVRTDRRTSR